MGRVALFLLLLGAGFAALAGAGVSATDGWSPAMPKGAKVAAGYMVLHNAGENADLLLSASSPEAERVELHTHLMEDGVMRMRQLSSVEVPPQAKVAFQPGGLHLMFFSPSAAFTDDGEIPVTLHFEKSGEIRTVLKVKKR